MYSTKQPKIPQTKGNAVKTGAKIQMPHGVSFLTPPGQTFKNVHISYEDKDVSLLQNLSTKVKMQDIADRTRKFRKDHPVTSNGKLLGNPTFALGDGSLNIRADVLRYWVYFGIHQLRLQKPRSLGEEYCALSVCSTVFDAVLHGFYMSVRPQDSQEDPGKIDAPGGTLNPDADNADPFKTIQSRLEKKLGLKDVPLVCIGVERIFDEHYSLYNIAMYGEVQDQLPAAKPNQYAAIPLAKVTDFLNGNQLTSPAKATLLLALSQEQFAEHGWGKEVVKKITSQ